MPATVKDIARTANVSAATVSMVLNGKAGISEETRARVLAAAASLGYVPRPARPARPPTATRTLRFLRISRHGHTVNRDHSTFISDYIDGMSQQAGRLGYPLEVVTHDGTPIEDIAASLRSAGLAGVVVLGTELLEGDVRLLQRAGLPMVVIDTFLDGVDCDFVDMNNHDALLQIVAHLVSRGFERIGFVASNVPTVNFRLRREAFAAAMRRFGLEHHGRDVITVDSTFDGAHADMAERLRGGLALPQALVCTNDIVTYGCIKALREFDVRIPQDLSVVGFDNLPMSAAMDPPLTTIDVSKRTIGELAITRLDERIRAADDPPAVKILVGARLVVRASVQSPKRPSPGPVAAQPVGLQAD